MKREIIHMSDGYIYEGVPLGLQGQGLLSKRKYKNAILVIEQDFRSDPPKVHSVPIPGVLELSEHLIVARHDTFYE